jgi:hypothetical protein
VLHEGPVPGVLSMEELTDVRARFLTERGWTSLAKAKRDFARRNATFAGYGVHEEVVLFFEHELYYQLQLIQVLDWLSGRDLEGTRLSLVQTDEYLGTLGPERLLALFHEQALEAIAGGRTTLDEVFVAHQECEEPVFLSDAVLASYLKDLSDTRKPLVLLEGGGTIGDPHAGDGLWNQEIVLTEKGREVLRATKIACD